MTEDELDLLVRSWIDYHARAWAAETGVEQQAPDHNDEAFWAVDELVDICRTDFDLCWKIICRIMEMHSGDATMASLAAGPLEYLLTTHGEEVIDRLEARARQDADF